mmetsp:Transcript_21843/g.85566  ORF Transcript_21843/g.85566 Transcript_21843/m.85566 type:complete len:441 (-) Transcript_21843:37-1359(-)
MPRRQLAHEDVDGDMAEDADGRVHALLRLGLGLRRQAGQEVGTRQRLQLRTHEPALKARRDHHAGACEAKDLMDLGADLFRAAQIAVLQRLPDTDEVVEGDDHLGHAEAVGRLESQLQLLRFGRAQHRVVQADGLGAGEHMQAGVRRLLQHLHDLGAVLLVQHQRPVGVRVVHRRQRPQGTQRGRVARDADDGCERALGIATATHEHPEAFLGVDHHGVLLFGHQRAQLLEVVDRALFHQRIGAQPTLVVRTSLLQLRLALLQLGPAPEVRVLLVALLFRQRQEVRQGLGLKADGIAIREGRVRLCQEARFRSQRVSTVHQRAGLAASQASAEVVGQRAGRQVRQAAQRHRTGVGGARGRRCLGLGFPGFRLRGASGRSHESRPLTLKARLRQRHQRLRPEPARPTNRRATQRPKPPDRQPLTRRTGHQRPPMPGAQRAR